MTRIRVHELAKELGKQNREIMELLRAEGIDVKRHRRRKKILSAYIMHRMPVMAEKEERNRLARSARDHRGHALHSQEARQWHRQNLLQQSLQRT